MISTEKLPTKKSIGNAVETESIGLGVLESEMGQGAFLTMCPF